MAETFVNAANRSSDHTTESPEQLSKYHMSTANLVPWSWFTGQMKVVHVLSGIFIVCHKQCGIMLFLESFHMPLLHTSTRLL
jgi:hypothetical protein